MSDEKYVYLPTSRKKTMLIPLGNIINGDVCKFLADYFSSGLALVNSTEGIVRITRKRLRRKYGRIKC